MSTVDVMQLSLISFLVNSTSKNWPVPLLSQTAVMESYSSQQTELILHLFWIFNCYSLDLAKNLGLRGS